ncbi:MAG: HAMP domain-containing sensor histidine kinase [Deltaproteobacteria bacterium]|nr:MAG: HAMP domain-containing sensor histidine kinase [Deltaproteobacteria bacterium]
MRLTFKLALALFLGVFAVHATFAASRIQRETELFERDVLGEQQVIGLVLVQALRGVWDEDGEAAARTFLDQADRHNGHQAFRWLGEPPSALDANGIAIRVDRDAEPMRVTTWMRVDAAHADRGVLEITDPLVEAEAYLAGSVQRAVATSALTALVAALIALAAGTLLVGGPTRRIIERAHRIGEGDFTGQISVHSRDELGAIDTELHAVAGALAEARDRVEAESHARSQTVEQLRHADRLATVGRLAAGVAHELGTPLNVVAARATMIADGEVSGDEVPRNATIIATQAQRMSRIIRGLLQFARTSTPTTEATDLGPLCAEVTEFLAPMAKKSGVRITRTGDDSRIAVVDRDQVLQAVLNIAMNGIQAMPDGGDLTVDLGARHATSPEGVEGEVAFIAVRDTGPGIAPEHRAHLFDPFFTTKDVSQGTGLGLSVSWGLIRDHGGWIDVESEPGVGSCLTILVPLEAS